MSEGGSPRHRCRDFAPGGHLCDRSRADVPRGTNGRDHKAREGQGQAPKRQEHPGRELGTMEAPLHPADSYVETLWNDLSDLEQYGHLVGATTLVNTRSAFAKAMILAAGNWLERRTLQALLLFTKSASSNEALVHLVENKVLKRKFHTLFDWELWQG